jgi:hypothetical protein
MTVIVGIRSPGASGGMLRFSAQIFPGVLQGMAAHNGEVCQRFKRISCAHPFLCEIFAFVFSEIMVL